MSAGMVFTSLVSFLISASACAAGLLIVFKRKEQNHVFLSYSLFLLTTGGLWFFVALRSLFAWAGADSADRVFFMIGQVFVFASGPILAHYLFFKIIKRENWARIITVFFAMVSVAALFFLFKEGVSGGGTTYFVTKYRPGKITFALFLLMIAPLVVASFADSVVRLLKIVFNKNKKQIYDFIYSAGVAAYLGLGIFDEQGFISGWGLVAFRLVFAAVFLAVYLAFQSQFQKSRSVLNIAELSGKQEARPSRGNSIPGAVIFRKILIILILLSLIPVAFSSFLTISTYQGALTRLKDNGFLEIEKLKQDISIQVFLVLVLLVILVIFASVLVAKSITNPISTLVNGVKEVSRGNLGIKFEIRSKDELGELAAVFNEMVKKLKEQRKREQLVAQLKTEFISIAAHQLRTPLSSVKWILKMLLDGDFGLLSVRQREFVDKGYAANDRMIHLVNDLLDVSRIEEGRFGFDFSENDLVKFLKESVESFNEDAKRRSVKLSLNINEAVIKIIFDPQRLKMAVSNLLDNSIRYTQPGGTVDVSTKEEGDFVVVSVKDAGMGIPDTQKGRIFTKFFRGDNVIKMQTEGSGLGLYLVKNIIEKHGGKIWFDSTENKGTTFYFALPVKKELIPYQTEAFEEFVAKV